MNSSHFLKVNCLSFFINLNHDLKKSFKKYLNFSSYSVRNKKIFRACNFLVDGTNGDSYFFHNLLDDYDVQNKISRIRKGLFRETNSMKKFYFEPSIEHQSFKLRGELHLTRKKILFILEKLKLLETV